jgi:uncharacterized UPF0160 family protein
MNHKVLVTHNGTIHADDLFACAALCLYLKNNGEEYKIIRSRDLETIHRADYVFDVGGVYDPAQRRFDHHQKGRAGKRSNGIYYSSFGLIWKEYGLGLCSGDHDAWAIIDQEIATPIDAVDNGQDLVLPKFKNVYPYVAERAFLVYQPSWKEDQNNVDRVFLEQVENIMQLLKREIQVALDNAEGARLIQESYKKSKDKRIVEIGSNFPRYLYQKVLSHYPEPVYVVYKSAHGESWKVEAVSKRDTMESRLPFPKKWRGVVNETARMNAKRVTGIEGIIFVHDSGFLANLDSRDHAYEFAHKALAYRKRSSTFLIKIFSH